jgi:hypothetical protein
MRYSSWIALIAAAAFVAATFTLARADDIPVGTGLSATLQESLDSRTSKVGDAVIMTITASPAHNAVEATLDGATIHGHVSEAVGATPTKKAYIGIAFDTITLADGRTYPFPAKIVALQKQKRTNAGQAAGEILAGMIVGNIIGKGMGSPMGGAAGAMGGVVYASQMSQNFRIPEKSTVKLQTTGEIGITGTHPQAPEPSVSP